MLSFEKLINTQNYILIWLVFLTTIVVNYLLNLIMEKSKINITKKKYIIILIIAILKSITYVAIGLNTYDRYIVFSEKVQSQYEAKVINKIKENTSYIFEFDIDAQAPRDIENTYSINLIERDDKNQELNQTDIKFGTFSGKKEIQITTKETTSEIKIEFKSEYPYANKRLIVEHCYINKKEIPLKYKYLPTKLVEKVQCLDINYKTAKERREMIKNAIQIAKENFFVGIGGEGWQYKYKDVQSYDYIANKLHSYTAKVVLEFGAIGFIIYIAIAILIISMLIKSIKQQDIEKISILFAIIIFGIHSMIDTDLEYAHILMYIFMLMGILSSKIKIHESRSKGADIILIVILIVSTYLTINSKTYNKYSDINNLILQRNGLSNISQEYKEINKNICKNYEELIKYEKYNYLDAYYNIIICCINSNSDEKLEVLEKYYEKFLNYKSENNVNSINKLEKINLIVEELEKQNNSKYKDITVKFNKIILDEYQKYKEKLLTNNADRVRLEEIYEKAQKVKSSYIAGVKVYNNSDIKIDEKMLENIEIEPIDEVLIYHTHGTESYKSGEKYETYEFGKSIDENYNVIKVGEYLKELLVEKGITTTHNKEYHNYPIKTGTYAKSRECVQKILDDNQNINKIIDVHRDAYSETEHTAKTIEIEGKRVAPLRFVIGINKEDKQ